MKTAIAIITAILGLFLTGVCGYYSLELYKELGANMIRPKDIGACYILWLIIWIMIWIWINVRD